MAAEHCYWSICFIPLDANGQKFFGFAEFLTGLALMVLAWTNADVRYKFRIKTAPIPLLGITFSVVIAVGIFTLLTDLWRAERWFVPQGILITQGLWQAILGAAFLVTFLIWAWFAFIRPPIYGICNAERFARTLYGYVLKGGADELAIIADELIRSVKSFVSNASSSEVLKTLDPQDRNKKKSLPKVNGYAHNIFLLLANKKLCRIIIESSPILALAIFQEIGETGKYGAPIETFAKNIVNEAISNRDSFLFHETSSYESGLIGYHKPLSQAMFSNYPMVEAIGTMLDPRYPESAKWDASQWEAYCRATLIVLEGYLREGLWGVSYVLNGAIGHIGQIASDIYQLNGVINSDVDNDSLARLRVAVKFVVDAVKMLDKYDAPKNMQLRLRDEKSRFHSIYDHLANMAFEIIFDATAVTSPRWECWWIQHNIVWDDLFGLQLDSRAGHIVQFKIRRIIYDEIKRLRDFPNFKGARILGLCLNVMGFKIGVGDHGKASRPLQKIILSWVKRNFNWLRSENERLAETCLVDGITFDNESSRIVKTYPAEGLRKKPEYSYLQLDPTSTYDEER